MRIRLRDAQLTLATVGLERYAKTTRLDRLWSTSIQATKVQNVDIGREITKEKERIGEALARVDAQRERLISQLSELEATERVLARYSRGPRSRRIHLPTDGSTGYVRLWVVYPYEADADKAVRFLARPSDVPVHRFEGMVERSDFRITE